MDVIAGEVNLYKYNHPNKHVNFWTIHENLCLENDAFKKSGVTHDELESFYNTYYTPEWDEMWAVNRIQSIAVHARELKALVDWKGFPASDPRAEENWLALDGLHPRYIDDYCKRNATGTSNLAKAIGQLSRSAALKAWESIKDTNAGKDMVQSGKFSSINSLVSSIPSSQAMHEPKIKRAGTSSIDNNQASLCLEDLASKKVSESNSGNPVSDSPSSISKAVNSSQDDINDTQGSDDRIELAVENKTDHSNTKEQKENKEQKEQKDVKEQKGQKEKKPYNPIANAIDKALTGTCKVGPDKLPIEKDLANRIREVLTMIESKSCRISIKQFSKTSSQDVKEASISFTHIVNDSIVKKRSITLTLEEVATDCSVAVYVLREFIKRSIIK